jgi:hypothetical protein
MRAALPFTFAACLLVALAPSTPPGAAAEARSICPTIAMECPETVPRPGTSITLKAKVSGNGFTNVTFKWVTSAGTITPESKEVINTPTAERAAVVDTTGLPGGLTVTVTFELIGLDRSCANTNSCTTAVLRPFEPHPIDRYGNIRFRDEQARLDNFAIELQNIPEMHGYIDCYGGRVGWRGEARARCERAKRYLTGHRGIAPDRIILVDGGYREDLSVGLWLLPAGTKFAPAPSLDPSEVRFTDAPKRRRRRPGSRRD